MAGILLPSCGASCGASRRWPAPRPAGPSVAAGGKGGGSAYPAPSPRSSSSRSMADMRPRGSVRRRAGAAARVEPDEGDNAGELSTEPRQSWSGAMASPTHGAAHRMRGCRCAARSRLRLKPWTEAPRRSLHGEDKRDHGSKPADQHQRSKRKNDRQVLAHVLLGAEKLASSQQLAIEATHPRRRRGLLDSKWHVVCPPLLESIPFRQGEPRCQRQNCDNLIVGQSIRLLPRPVAGLRRWVMSRQVV